jgi:hypothetical protein
MYWAIAMPILTNAKHERFVQAIFEGETADAAYAKAGYKPNDGNCIRLKGNERVKARLAELQAQAAKKSAVTVESLLDELEAARARADVRILNLYFTQLSAGQPAPGFASSRLPAGLCWPR